MEITPPFPFIVGSPRSGTTLLRLMLGSHPDVAIPAEAQFLVPLAKVRTRYEGPSFSSERLILDLRRRPEFRRWKLPDSEVRGAMEDAAPSNFPDAMRSIYALQARRHHKQRYGDKTPRHVFSMPLLLSLFPEARFIHVIRDGRDVALSLVEMPWFSGDLTAAALHWKRSVGAGRAAGARLGSGRYLEVRYERLLEEPEAVLETVCHFVSLSFDAAMLDHRSRLERDFRPPEGLRQHEHLYLQPTAGLRDWRRDMDPKQLATVEASIGDTLDELGYELGATDIPLAIRGIARARRLREALRLRIRRSGTSEVLG